MESYEKGVSTKCGTLYFAQRAHVSNASRNFFEAICGGAMLTCGTLTALLHLAIEDQPSVNVSLKELQDFLAKQGLGKQQPALFTAFLFAIFGFAASSVIAYHNTPDAMAKAVMLYVIPAAVDAWWNLLCLTAAERILVVMPVASSVLFLWALLDNSIYGKLGLH